MELPTDWYVLILPGLVVLACLIPLTTLERESFEWIIGSDILGKAIILGLVGYIAGFSANALLLNVIKPIIPGQVLQRIGITDATRSPSIENYAQLFKIGRTDLLNAISASYQGMLLYRGLFFGFFLIFITSLVGIIWRKDHIGFRLISLAVVILLSIALGKSWYKFRENHNTFVNEIFKVLDTSSGLNNAANNTAHRDTLSTIPK